jgi:hypothetical protein
MTAAMKDHGLSKLDLFTPNALHLGLPPLTTGFYTTMGSAATMILERDVLSRKAHILRLLGPIVGAKAKGEGYLHRRTAAHERIISHMGLYYSCGSGGGSREGGWRRAPTLTDAALEKAAKSMQTAEGRREYVRKGLQKEWEALGMKTGTAVDDAVELD